MIHDGLDKSSLYKGIAPNLDRAIDLLDRLGDLSLKPGRNDVDDDLYIMNFSYDTVGEEEGIYEYHEQFIDIQLLLHGEEIIRLGDPAERSRGESFDAEADTGLCPLTEGTDIGLKPGNFALFFPGELHAPKLAVGEPSPVRKIIVKVRSAF